MRENLEIVVPKIIGFPLLEAEKMMQQRKINVKVDRVEESAEVPENTVISQSVEPGTIVKQDRTISIKVSKQLEKMEVPNLMGKDLLDAKKTLEKFNLKLMMVAYGCHPKIKNGKVISQNPQSDEVVTTRSMQLLVSSGACQNHFVIQNLIDHKVDNVVKKEFTDRDIDLKLISTTQSRENVVKGRVITQDPLAGSIVKSGDSVVLTME